VPRPTVTVLMSWCRAQHLGTGDFLAPPCVRGTDLFEQIAAFLGGQRFDQLLFGFGQGRFEADQENIADDVARMSFGPRPM
jgi:hypothetical protein